jgi:hypothetical protein
MNPLVWLKNTLKARWGATLIGRAVGQAFPATPLLSIKLVCATRLSERAFWRTSALGRSLAPYQSDPNLSIDIRFLNSAGLPEVYNRHLVGKPAADIVVFVHDDVWLDDADWLAKVRLALRRFDIVGVAGNTRVSKNQPAWLFRERGPEGFVWDSVYLSGSIGHGHLSRGPISHYGPAPVRCKLLDGVFLAARSLSLVNSKVLFDERFRFHFYDMDFCRSADRAGLALGTWPITLTHQSQGVFGNPQWEEGHGTYFKKWKR